MYDRHSNLLFFLKGFRQNQQLINRKLFVDEFAETILAPYETKQA